MQYEVTITGIDASGKRWPGTTSARFKTPVSAFGAAPPLAPGAE